MRKTWVGLLVIALVALAGATIASASVEEPAINFCPGNASTKSAVTTDTVAGVTYTSSVFVPRTATGVVPVGVYFNNDGPGPITFPFGGWSTAQGGAIPFVTWTLVPTTPSDSLFFNDGAWSGTYPVGLDFLGCVYLLAPDDGFPRASVHLDFSFTRDAVLYTERVDVHFR